MSLQHISFLASASALWSPDAATIIKLSSPTRPIEPVTRATDTTTTTPFGGPQQRGIYSVPYFLLTQSCPFSIIYRIGRAVLFRPIGHLFFDGGPPTPTEYENEQRDLGTGFNRGQTSTPSKQ